MLSLPAHALKDAFKESWKPGTGAVVAGKQGSQTVHKSSSLWEQLGY